MDGSLPCSTVQHLRVLPQLLLWDFMYRLHKTSDSFQTFGFLCELQMRPKVFTSPLLQNSLLPPSLQFPYVTMFRLSLGGWRIQGSSSPGSYHLRTSTNQLLFKTHFYSYCIILFPSGFPDLMSCWWISNTKGRNQLIPLLNQVLISDGCSELNGIC